jgi:hypothetical protein
MKKLFILLFTIALFLPLYAQETETNKNELDENMSNWGKTGGNDSFDDDNYSEKEDTEFGGNLGPRAKKPFYFARHYFEFGYDAGVGFDNGIMGTSDIFRKNMVIDVSQLARDIDEDGAGFNFDISGDFCINVMNVPLGGGIWGFGFSGTTEGSVNFNLPESLFKLIAEGNIKKPHSSSGTISASGGIYADAGLNASAKYQNLKVGIRYALYTPLAFVPKSGISYHLQAEETLYLEAGGEIIIYTPFAGNGGLQFGSDVSLEGEYALYNFLDVGGSLSHIPLVAAQMENGIRLTLDKDKFNYEIKDPFTFEKQNPPELDFETDNNYKSKNPVKVYRPLRFDVYARYKPFYSEFVVVKPNMGFTVDINDQEGFFNIGLEGRLNFKDLFIVHLGTGLQESIWKHRLGFALNLRAFELDLEGSLRSQYFVGSWTGQGFGLDIGMRFGW